MRTRGSKKDLRAEFPEAAINKIREATDVDEGTAARLMEYIDAVVEENSAYTKQLSMETCSRRSQLRSIADLAREFDRTRVAAESRRVQLVRGAQSILNRNEMERLDLFLHSISERSTFIQTDYERALEISGRTAEEVLAEYCES